MLLLKFVLKTNYLHIRNELKAYVYYLCFLKYWQISIFLSYQISSPSMQAHLRSHIGRGACLWEGWFYQILSNIANHKDEPDGYWISRDLWQFGGKILHDSFNCFSLSDMSLTWQDNHQNWFLPTTKIITILWLIVFHVRYTCLDYIIVGRNMLQWPDSFDSKLSM